MIREVKRAKKEYPCSYGTLCTIRVGDVYTDDILTPWDMIVEDVDEDGRSIATLHGEWFHDRYHQKCQDEMIMNALW